MGHRAFYFYSRSLCEAVEFFGEGMPLNMKVYHGLSQKFVFDQFTAFYLNQPVSTTPSFETATKFAAACGNCFILELKRSASNPQIIPKFLDVSWLSNYPGEDERLFNGNNVLFEICDIVQTQPKIKRHQHELRILKIFQNMVSNQNISWIKKNEEEAK